MEAKNAAFKVRLGIFIITGTVLFFLAIFIIGKQKNLFDPVFSLSAHFRNVSGLQVGNTVRFSGINVGTVDNIRIVNDSTVTVSMLIKKDVQRFIKTDSEAGIGSEGIIGDKVVVLSQGSAKSPMVRAGQLVASSEPVETDAILESLQVTSDNAAIASGEITDILVKINRGEGTLGRLIQDKKMAENIDATLGNLKRSSKGLEENMEAAKHNFLLRGYFRKKEKEKQKKLEAQKEATEKKAKEAKKAAEKAKTKTTK